MQSFNELLIEQIKKHEMLYNVTHRQYRNIQKKEKTWHKIADNCDTNVDECKKRWRGLRDTYKRRKRSEKVKSGSQRKRWKYMDHMSFLDRLKDISETVESASEDAVLDEDSISNFFASTGFTDCPHSSFLDNESASSPQRNKTPKKQDDAEVKVACQKMLQECVGTVKELAATPKERTATSLLFESLARKIIDAQLPQAALLRIEYKVMSTVYEELTKLEGNS